MLSYAHAHPLGSVELGEGFSRVPTIPDPTPLTVFRSGRDPQVQSSSLEKAFFCLFFGDIRARRRPRQKLLCFLGVAGGTIERSCYSPHYVNAEVDYERDYQETLPQGPAQQQAGASPVTGTPTAVAIGSGSAASVG